MKSWKTTATGVIGIVVTVLTAAKMLIDNDPTTNPDWTATITAVSTSLGLLFAKDSNVTGGTVEQ